MGQIAGLKLGIESQRIVEAIVERERLGSTGFGGGIAIPHGKHDSVKELVGVLGRSVAGLEFESIDGKPTHLVFMLVAPTNSAGTHLKALARLSRLFRDTHFRQKLMEAPDASAMHAVIANEDTKY